MYIIAEMSANHGGSFENAIEIVRQAAKAGADCLKIQTYTADSITIDCDNEYFKVKGGLWDGYNLYDLYKEAGTPYEWQAKIKEECEKCGMDFLSTPFIPLIEYAASKGKPMIMSTGMASLEEMQEAIDACRRVGNEQVILLKCCSEYPTPWESMHLGNIPDMKERFNIPIGLSDHSAGSLGAVVGVALGACVIEKHVMLEGVESADSKFSMTMQEFAQMVKDVRNTQLIAKGPIYELSENEKKQSVFRRSLFAAEDIKAGEIFTNKNVRDIRPAYGISPKYLKDLLGKTADRDIKKGDPITEEILEKTKEGK